MNRRKDLRRYDEIGNNLKFIVGGGAALIIVLLELNNFLYLPFQADELICEQFNYVNENMHSYSSPDKGNFLFILKL